MLIKPRKFSLAASFVAFPMALALIAAACVSMVGSVFDRLRIKYGKGDPWDSDY